MRMRSLLKELVRLKKNVQAYTKQRGSGDIAPVVQQICFFTVYNYGNYSNVLENRWENNSVHYINGNALKSLSLLGKN